MRKIWLVALLAILTCVVILGSDWPTQGGSPQREGWAKSERAITKDNVSALQLLYRYQADNQSRGLYALTSPIINGNLITYRGFKEMLVFGGSSDNVFSVDADLNRLLWNVHLDYRGDKPQIKTSTSVCPGGLTAPVAMAGSSSASMRFGRGGAAVVRRPPGTPPPAGIVAPPPQGNAMITAGGFGHLAVFYSIGSDGYLHLLNSSTGQDLFPPVKFLPENAKVTSLNVFNGAIYATTADNCDGAGNALYAIDLTSEAKKVVSFTTNGSGFSGIGGTSIGNDGTVYAQVASGHGDAAGAYNNTVLALTPKELTVKDYFTPPGGPSTDMKNSAATGITPLVFSWRGKEMLAAGSSDGRLYLLDAMSLGGADHHTPLFKTDPIATPKTNDEGYGFRGTFSSWQDYDTEARWIYAPLSGGIVALKLGDQNDQPTLQPIWTSRDIAAPAPVAIANGLVFALSTGEAPRDGKKDSATHATLYVLDGSTGKELYSSGNAVSSFSHASGLAIANGRVYFGTHDNTIYCFGFPKANPQLTDK
jgi:outer membrane protein assembly factor BamB